MSLGNIFILDDDPQIRHVLQVLLKTRGFNVLAARDSSEAQEKVSLKNEDIDVAVLDMRLDESEDFLVTGDQVGLVIRERQPEFPPEFVIYSGFSDFADYYRRAVSLGVATYLEKRSVSPKSVIRHIRALALRRSLSIQNPRIMNEIERASQSANGLYLATARFARDTIGKKMSATLGVNVVLFLSENSTGILENTKPCGEAIGLPPNSLDVYDRIQRFIFAGPERILSVGNMRRAGLRDEGRVLETLGEAFFVPLAKTRDLALSMTILPLDSNTHPLAENASLMADVAGEYLRDAAVQHLLEISARWAQAEERRRRVPRIAAELFDRVGREQLRILDEAGPVDGLAPGFDLAALRDLGLELLQAGEFLREVTDTSEEIDVELAPLIDRSWVAISDELEIGDLSTFELKGDAIVRSEPTRLGSIFSGIFGWLARRHNPDKRRDLSIRVLLKTSEHFVRVQVEDQSPRLSKEQRQPLFNSFLFESSPLQGSRLGEKQALQLFLVKLLAESQVGVSLTDETEARSGRKGHRFLLCLPRASELKK